MEREATFLLFCTKKPWFAINKTLNTIEENTGKYRSVEFTSPLTVAFQHVAKSLAAQIVMGNYN